jgi:hypothetical protein
MGGGLLQKMNRDTMSFATKLSLIGTLLSCFASRHRLLCAASCCVASV